MSLYQGCPLRGVALYNKGVIRQLNMHNKGVIWWLNMYNSWMVRRLNMYNKRVTFDTSYTCVYTCRVNQTQGPTYYHTHRRHKEIGGLAILPTNIQTWTITAPQINVGLVKSPTVQDMFQTIPGLTSFAGLIDKQRMLSHARRTVRWLALLGRAWASPTLVGLHCTDVCVYVRTYVVAAIYRKF